MSYGTVRDELKAILAAIPGVEKVHDHLRWANRREELLSFYRTSGRFNAWEFTRVREEREQAALPNRFRHRHTMQIHGYYAMREGIPSSETAFQDLTEEVLNTLQRNVQLNGKAEMVFPPSAEYSHEMKSNTLVHRIRITLEITELVNF
jgi:hypothetical protein